MTAFDQLLTELAGLPGNHIVRPEELEEALVSVALKDCKPGFITLEGTDGASFTLEGILVLLSVCRKDPEATSKMKRVADLIDRATEEIGAGGRIQ
jgi:hypothetical protein